MDSNPFAIDAIDDFDSGSPDLERLLLHEDALDALSVAVFGARVDPETRDGGKGRVVLLISPQPGSGKTHLIARLNGVEGHLMIPLRFRSEGAADWESVLADALVYTDATPASPGGITLLEARARNVFAELTANLIRAGAIPCPNEEQALRALTERPEDVFDFAASGGDVVKWFCGVFETLMPAFAEEAVRCYSITHGEAIFWLRELYDYCRERANGETPRGSRVERFLDNAEEGWAEGGVQSIAKKKFSSFGKIIAARGSLTFVVDHLDPLYGNQEKGREIACLLLELPRLIPGSATVLSVNADLWESIFNGRLPGAIEDRLTSNMISLGGISFEEGARLIDNRLLAAGIPDDMKFRFLPLVGLKELFETDSQRGVTPRRVLRHAKDCWQAFALSGYGSEEESGAGGRPGRAASVIGKEGGKKDEEQGATPVSDEEKETAMPFPEENAEKGGVEFVSLTEDLMKIHAFEPLEPLWFESPLTVSEFPQVPAPSPAAKPESVPDGSLNPAPGVVPKRKETTPPAETNPPAKTDPARGNASTPFNWAAAAAARGESVESSPTAPEIAKPEPEKERPLAAAPPNETKLPAPPLFSEQEKKPEAIAPAPEPVPESAPEAIAPAPEPVPESAPEPAPEAVPPAPEPEPEHVSGTPQLADTVGDLVKEAEEGFSAFRDIFRQAMIGEEEAAAMMSTPVPVEDVTPAPETVELNPAPAKELEKAREVDEPVAPPTPSALEELEFPAFEMPGLAAPGSVEPPSEPEPEPEPAMEVEAEPAEASAPAPEVEPEVEPEPEAVQPVNGGCESLPGYYNQLRHEAVESVSTTEIDLLRFYLVIRAVGEIFPVVTQREFDLPGKPGYRVIAWSYDSHDIIFGFLGVEHADYWQSLTNYALQARSGSGDAAWPEGGREVKVVVLTPAGLPLDVASWTAALKLPAESSAMLDSVEIDAQTVGAVYAAAHLLGEAASATSAHSARDILSFVTRELDYFWRRLTRPKASVRSGAPFERG